MNLLEVKNLKTSFKVDGGSVKAVRGISFSVEYGQSIGIVGESGCGKSVSMMSLMRLLPSNATISAEHIIFQGKEISNKPDSYYQNLRGGKIGMIFQDSMTSLNPLLTIGEQLSEPLKIHQGLDHRRAMIKALEMLNMVEVTNPKGRLKQYPFELSGGMRQRVMIAMALSCNPNLLIADEPTTALDVTISAQILALMRELQERLSTSIILITHDLGVVANMCTHIYVVYGGIVVEHGSTYDIFKQPGHPYTQGLLTCIPGTQLGNKKAKLVPIMGTPPDLINPPKGCPFTDRCKDAMLVCREHMPQEYFNGTHMIRCHLLHPFARGLAHHE